MGHILPTPNLGQRAVLKPERCWPKEKCWTNCTQQLEMSLTEVVILWHVYYKWHRQTVWGTWHIGNQDRKQNKDKQIKQEAQGKEWKAEQQTREEKGIRVGAGLICRKTDKKVDPSMVHGIERCIEMAVSRLSLPSQRWQWLGFPDVTSQRLPGKIKV